MQSPPSLLHLVVRCARLDRPESVPSLRVSFPQVYVAEADYRLVCQPALALHVRDAEVVLGTIRLLTWRVMEIILVHRS
jgi:hypothetical protein